MAYWFLRGLGHGIVTTRYPKAIDVWTQTLPTPPAFHSDRLTLALADRLVAVCPSRALAREADELVVDLGACTACGRCIDEGRGAVEASGVFELASTSRERLVKRVRIGGGAG
jgi:heterodisulfide reductase subunit A-like polyferredoxin